MFFKYRSWNNECWFVVKDSCWIIEHGNHEKVRQPCWLRHWPHDQQKAITTLEWLGSRLGECGGQPGYALDPWSTGCLFASWPRRHVYIPGQKLNHDCISPPRSINSVPARVAHECQIDGLWAPKIARLVYFPGSWDGAGVERPYEQRVRWKVGWECGCVDTRL